MTTKRRFDESVTLPVQTCASHIKTSRVDTSLVKEMTLKRIMNAGQVYRSKLPLHPINIPQPQVELILCEGCHKRTSPAELNVSSSSALVGECRFCSRRSLCADCWSLCAVCGWETCPLCSVKDYSSRETVAVCLDCKRHKPALRR